MIKITKCSKCNHDISIKLLSGYVHVKCENCNEKYVLTQNSLRYYLFLPLISVASCVVISKNFIPQNEILLKLIFIIVASYLLNVMLGKILIKQKILQYEIKED